VVTIRPLIRVQDGSGIKRGDSAFLMRPGR
jgi:hypothetical protein